MRFLLATIGYSAVATVLAAALGLGYLWQSERLTDERLFRIVAMLHGVDVDQAIAGGEGEEAVQATTPDEEPSLVEEERLRQIALRNLEVKQASLDRGRTEFDHALSELLKETNRFDEMARELNQRLEQESTETANEGVRAVVRDLQAASATQGKDLLLQMLDSGGMDPKGKQEAMDKVIRLINAMPPNTWADILRKFQKNELLRLHEIQLQQLDGGPKKRVLDEAMQSLRDREAGG